MNQNQEPDKKIKPKYHTGATGEYLVATELSKRGFTASTLPGGAPQIDILAYKDGVAIPIQVKASKEKCVSLDAKKFADIEFEGEIQSINRDNGRDGKNEEGEIDPYLIWIIVFLGKENDSIPEFYICRGSDIQKAVIDYYSKFLEGLEIKGRRPRNWETTHHGLYPNQITDFKDNWGLLEKEITLLKTSIAKARTSKS